MLERSNGNWSSVRVDVPGLRRSPASQPHISLIDRFDHPKLTARERIERSVPSPPREAMLEEVTEGLVAGKITAGEAYLQLDLLAVLGTGKVHRYL